MDLGVRTKESVEKFWVLSQGWGKSFRFPSSHPNKVVPAEMKEEVLKVQNEVIWARSTNILRSITGQRT
jgi:hypothetical protein